MLQKGGTRMKQKRTIWTYGLVKQPVEVGKGVEYYQNGVWKTTAKVLKVIEQADNYIRFETERLRYCIEYQRTEENVMALAA